MESIKLEERDLLLRGNTAGHPSDGVKCLGRMDDEAAAHCTSAQDHRIVSKFRGYQYQSSMETASES